MLTVRQDERTTLLFLKFMFTTTTSNYVSPYVSPHEKSLRDLLFVVGGAPSLFFVRRGSGFFFFFFFLNFTFLLLLIKKQKRDENAGGGGFLLTPQRREEDAEYAILACPDGGGKGEGASDNLARERRRDIDDGEKKLVKEIAGTENKHFFRIFLKKLFF